MKRWTAVSVIFAAVALFVWIAVAQMPDGQLHLVFLDVGGGQGVLVRTPSGRSILIDGGTDPSTLLTALGRRLPYWQHTLHAVIATGNGANPSAALFDVCRRYSVLTALAPPASQDSGPVLHSWRTLLAQQSIPFVEAQAGMALQTPDGLTVETLAVDNGRLALRLTYRELDVILPGAAQPSDVALDATIVAYPSSASSPQRLPVGPSTRVVILFTGARAAAAQALPVWPGLQVYSTAVHGGLDVSSDGYDIAVNQLR